MPFLGCCEDVLPSSSEEGRFATIETLDRSPYTLSVGSLEQMGCRVEELLEVHSLIY